MILFRCEGSSNDSHSRKISHSRPELRSKVFDQPERSLRNESSTGSTHADDVWVCVVLRPLQQRLDRIGDRLIQRIAPHVRHRRSECMALHRRAKR